MQATPAFGTLISERRPVFSPPGDWPSFGMSLACTPSKGRTQHLPCSGGGVRPLPRLTSAAHPCTVRQMVGIRFAGRRAALIVAASAILVAACGGAATTPQPTAPATEQLFPPASQFDSPLYGYSIALPDGWRPEPATEAWDGAPGSFGSDTANSDRFHFQRGLTVWAVAAQTEKSLAELTDDQMASDVELHDCAATPDTDEPTTLDGDPARLTAKHCPTDSPTEVATESVIHDGKAYVFYFIHPELIAPDPNDLDLFGNLLDGVTFN